MHFAEIATKLSELDVWMNLKEAEDVDAWGRIAALEETKDQDDNPHVTPALRVCSPKSRISLSTVFGILVSEVSIMRSAGARILIFSAESERDRD